MDIDVGEDMDSYPLISACSKGDLQSVKRLVREGVDVSGDMGNAETPLITAVTRGNCQLVRFLIKSGADVNRAVVTGQTAAHACVTASQLKCLKMLMENGVRLDMKYQGMTPLLLASTQGKAEIVKYLISLPSCSRANKIEALEVLGAAYIDDMDDAANAHFYWWWSLTEREGAEPGDQVQPKSEETHPAFQVKEFKTEDELNALESATDQLWMQSLLIRERVFGPQHRPSSAYVIRRSITYADRANFDRSIPLLTYILDEEHKSSHAHHSTLKSLCSHINKFSNLMSKGSPVKHQHVMAVLGKIVEAFEYMKSAGFMCWDELNEGDFIDDWDLLDREQVRIRSTCSQALYAAITAVGLLAQLEPSMSADDNLEFRQVLSKFVNLDLRVQLNHTPLHVACLRERSSYSPLAVVRLLLEAGADPRAVCAGRDTPLHLLHYNHHPTKPHIIQLMLDSGAHYDACNFEGRSFTQLNIPLTLPRIPPPYPFMPGNPMKYVSLQCLSARVVKRNYIPYHSKVPAIVAEFIELH